MSQSDIQKMANKLFSGSADFLLSATGPEHFPKSKLPEIAFIGRSNVGKSSLINALTNRKNLARTSNTPGRTQQINFFDINHQLMLVDLPGYGHAKAPREEKDRWNELVQHYIQTRPALRCVGLLIDSRHGALANDLEMMKFLDRAAISYQVILTKIDQIKAIERDGKKQQVEAMLGKHPAARSEVFSASAEKNIGIEELRTFLTSLIINS